MSENEALIDCPHCGGPGELREFKGMFRHGWVGCPVCKIYKNWTYDPTEAIATWNRSAKK